LSVIGLAKSAMVSRIAASVCAIRSGPVYPIAASSHTVRRMEDLAAATAEPVALDTAARLNVATASGAHADEDDPRSASAGERG